MFDISIPGPADLAALADAELVDAATATTQAENAVCARKLAVRAELFIRRTTLARTLDERRNDAHTALLTGITTLACQCGNPDRHASTNPRPLRDITVYALTDHTTTDSGDADTTDTRVTAGGGQEHQLDEEDGARAPTTDDAETADDADATVEANPPAPPAPKPRRHRLDRAHRPHLHHPPRQPTAVPRPVPTHRHPLDRRTTQSPTKPTTRGHDAAAPKHPRPQPRRPYHRRTTTERPNTLRHNRKHPAIPTARPHPLPILHRMAPTRLWQRPTTVLGENE
ncbi:hypothetical protein [Mycolicibacterium austroafricanum]|uniref:hypothetical protein n=1 Tax=Mycolicibacterium austroafricanum TaxID=39687 RepID=UPI000562BBD0|nr:hypothetical protein [Mycolicibacterium austroafricanum]